MENSTTQTFTEATEQAVEKQQPGKPVIWPTGGNADVVPIDENISRGWGSTVEKNSNYDPSFIASL